MPDAARYIERLALTAPAEAGLVRGRLLVEDAFRIASFPGEAERRVLAIRRVDLGVVDPERSSAALAPVIEEAVRAAAGRAVRFDDPTAAAADAVYFPDELAAATAFVERLASASSPMEWFWDSVFEGGVPPGDAEAGGRLALNCLLEFPGGPARVAMLVDVLRARGTVDRLLAWLQPMDGVRLLGAFGLDAAPDRPRAAASGPAAAPPFLTSALHAWHQVIARWIGRWGEDDPRSFWLAAVVLVSAQPSLLAATTLSELTIRVLRAAGPSRVTPVPGRRKPWAGSTTKPTLLASTSDVERAVRAPGSSSSLGRSDVPGPPRLPARHVDRRRTKSAVNPGTSTRVPPSPATESEVARPERTAPALDFDLHATAAAGLLFVVPLLARLGIAETLEANAALVELAFPQRLLLFIADRVRVLQEDAVRIPLQPAGPGQPPDGWDRVLATWLARVRRVARRQCGMGLRALVARPGQIAFTRTHLDVVLPLRELDIRVRRAGLDADPGWVPWLGRIVSFHYEAEP